MTKYLCNIDVPSSIITPIDSAVRFPEVLESSYAKYKGDIELFCDLIATSKDSGALLHAILRLQGSDRSIVQSHGETPRVTECVYSGDPSRRYIHKSIQRIVGSARHIETHSATKDAEK